MHTTGRSSFHDGIYFASCYHTAQHRKLFLGGRSTWQGRFIWDKCSRVLGLSSIRLSEKPTILLSCIENGVVHIIFIANVLAKWFTRIRSRWHFLLQNIRMCWLSICMRMYIFIYSKTCSYIPNKRILLKFVHLHGMEHGWEITHASQFLVQCVSVQCFHVDFRICMASSEKVGRKQ